MANNDEETPLRPQGQAGEPAPPPKSPLAGDAVDVRPPHPPQPPSDDVPEDGEGEDRSYWEEAAPDPASPMEPADHPRPPEGFVDRSNIYITLSIMEIFLCGGLFALIPLIYSMNYQKDIGRGDFEKARRREIATRVWLVVAFILGALMVAAYFSSLSQGSAPSSSSGSASVF